MPDIRHFELRRKPDGLVYRFDQMPLVDGSYGYRRRDTDLWILLNSDFGWIAVDPKTESIAGRPLSVLLRNQSDAPPEGDWVSEKRDKSYVYELVHDLQQ